MALTAFPTLNASLSEDKSSLLQHQDHNIGVAMDTEKGLLVPSISMVQERSILEIAEVYIDHFFTADYRSGCIGHTVAFTAHVRARPRNMSSFSFPLVFFLRF